jgi:hypothetical protein
MTVYEILLIRQNWNEYATQGAALALLILLVIAIPVLNSVLL